MLTIASARLAQDGDARGIVTSDGCGYAVGKSIALGYLRVVRAGACNGLEIEIPGDGCLAVSAPVPLYDPRARERGAEVACRDETVERRGRG
jgi:glycine cleavage system aminomethyltransferase T